MKSMENNNTMKIKKEKNNNDDIYHSHSHFIQHFLILLYLFRIITFLSTVFILYFFSSDRILIASSLLQMLEPSACWDTDQLTGTTPEPLKAQIIPLLSLLTSPSRADICTQRCEDWCTSCR